MAVLRFFAAARVAAGTSRAEVDGATVAEVLDAAVARFGSGLAEVLPSCAVWVNGEPAGPRRARCDAGGGEEAEDGHGSAMLPATARGDPAAGAAPGPIR